MYLLPDILSSSKGFTRKESLDITKLQPEVPRVGTSVQIRTMMVLKRILKLRRSPVGPALAEVEKVGMRQEPSVKIVRDR